MSPCCKVASKESADACALPSYLGDPTYDGWGAVPENAPPDLSARQLTLGSLYVTILSVHDRVLSELGERTG